MQKQYVVKRKDKEIYRGKICNEVKSLKEAHKTTLEKATNMLAGIKTMERNSWSIYLTSDLVHPISTFGFDTEMVSEEKIANIKEIIEDKEKLLQMTSEISLTFTAVKAIKEESISELSETDMALSDIYHFIEFTDNLNLAQTYKVMQLLKAVLKKRRKAKDKILIASIYEKSSSKNITDGRLQKSIRGVFEKEYTNRVLQNLSDIVTMKKEEFNEFLYDLD